MKRPGPLAIAVIATLVLVVIGAVAVRVVLGGDRIKAAIEAQASTALGQPVAIGQASPHLFPRIGLELERVVIGHNREVTVERARLTTGFRALLGRRVEGADITIEHSQIDLRWALGLFGALIDASATATSAPGASTPGLVIDSIGSLVLRDVTLTAGSRSVRVHMESSLSGGDRFVVHRATGTSDESDVSAAGELSSVARRTGTFAVDARTLDLDGLLALLAASTPAGASASATPQGPQAPPVTPLHVDVTIRAREGRAFGAAFTNLDTVARIRGAVVDLEGLTLGMFGGRVAASARLDGSANVPTYDWRGSLENIDVPELVAFAGSPGAMTGRLSGTFALSATGLEPIEAMRAARGTARLTIADGRISNLDLVRTVVLASGKPSGEHPAGSGEAFSRLSASLAVGDRRIATEDLSLQSRDLDMNGEGTLSLATQAVAFRTDLILSRELSAQAGRDLYKLAHEGDRVVVPAKISGTVMAPTAIVDVQAALGRALRNRAQDELKSLLERLGKRGK